MTRYASLIERFERFAVGTLMLLLVLLVATGLGALVVLMVVRIPQVLPEIRSVERLQEAVQRGFGGVLIVLLGLELLDTIRVYFREHRFRVEVILFVAMIAVGRHIVQLEGAGVDGVTLFGLGGIMLALAASYYLVRRAPQG
jgi:uncharacterized membrane protein (DUF373 family)